MSLREAKNTEPMTSKRRRSPELKAQVMGALLAGQGVCEVAKKFNIDRRIVS